MTIDGHCHLDRRLGTSKNALIHLYRAALKSDISQITLLNIPEIAFDNIQVLKDASRYDNYFNVFPCLNPLNKKSLENLHKLNKLGISGLKLHPRLHGYSINNRCVVDLIKCAAELNLPVLIDCFPDGKNLMLGNIPESFLSLAQSVPDARVAIGHAGGHRIMDALMVAKYCKNIFLDLSFTLLYYSNSRVINDIAFCIKSMQAKRIFWGTDYPDRPYEKSVTLSMTQFGQMMLDPTMISAIYSDNIKHFLGSNQ